MRKNGEKILLKKKIKKADNKICEDYFQGELFFFEIFSKFYGKKLVGLNC